MPSERQMRQNWLAEPYILKIRLECRSRVSRGGGTPPARRARPGSPARWRSPTRRQDFLPSRAEATGLRSAKGESTMRDPKHSNELPEMYRPRQPAGRAKPRYERKYRARSRTKAQEQRGPAQAAFGLGPCGAARGPRCPCPRTCRAKTIYSL